jgi:hypothetical protein
MISQFSKYVAEDYKQLIELLKKYTSCPPEDVGTLYDITQEGLILSQRWNDISSNSSIYAKEYGISKTDFKDWSYHNYRILHEMHVDGRVLYKDAKEDLKNFGRVE